MCHTTRRSPVRYVGAAPMVVVDLVSRNASVGADKLFCDKIATYVLRELIICSYAVFALWQDKNVKWSIFEKNSPKYAVMFANRRNVVSQ